MTKILLVEDDDRLATAFQRALTEQHYIVEVANDGQEGWEKAELFQYDLIVLDWILPKLDGIDFCKKLRLKGDTTPVLLVTAQDAIDRKIIGLDAGVDDYVTKPVSFQELHAHIRALLRRSQLALTNILRWGKLEVNPNLCQVTYNGKLVTLRNKEYSLLELLLRNNQRIFSQQALIQALWTPEGQPSENTVRAHIKSIRKQLKQVGAGDLIETLYGLGYRLKSESLESLEPSSADLANVELSPVASELSASWERYRDRYSDRLKVIEQVVSALYSGIGNKPLLQQAQREAHTLIGSLGSFGLDEATQTARQIEQILARIKGSLLAPKKLELLAHLVERLRYVIDHSVAEPLATPSETQVEMPMIQPQWEPQLARLLIVDDDGDFAGQLAIAANFSGLESTVAVSLADAREVLAHSSGAQLPNVVLLDLGLSSASDGLLLLKEIQATHPQIPVIVLTAHEDFSERVEVARLGGRGFLQKPILPFQVMAIVSQLLQQSTSRESKLLIVDDDPQILEVLGHALKVAGFHLTLLSDPRKFWETLENTNPDLLILNVEMPNWTGLELCQVIRNDLRWSKLPIVFLSAHTDDVTIRRAFAAGADDYLSKPVAPREVVNRVLNRLNRVKNQRMMLSYS